LAEDFTIIGAGAIGAIVGAHLIRAGRSIAFIEANADHVAVIRVGGLRLSDAMDATYTRRCSCPTTSADRRAVCCWL
jgi:2-dehydropantoate 2-reductase